MPTPSLDTRARRRARAALAAAALLAAIAVEAQPGPDAGVRPLGTYPLCETSAVRWVACGADGGRCTIVGDNEWADGPADPTPPTNVFLLKQNTAGDLVDQQPLRLHLTPAGIDKIDDIEAIDVRGDEILVFGSHGRKSFKPTEPEHCKIDGGRLAYARLRRDGATLSGAVVKTSKDAWRTLLSAAGCRDTLIAVPAEGPPRLLADQACAAIVAADQGAATDAPSCNRAFNIEGVATLPSADASPRVWVGLRSPLVDGKAVLLRLRDAATLQFDGIALADLNGFGVRDLAFARGALWLLGGPMADDAIPGTLWSVPATEVASGAVIAPTRVAAVDPLPAFAEGLAIDEQSGAAVFVVDGDLGKTPGACKTPGGQLRRQVAPPAAAAATPTGGR